LCSLFISGIVSHNCNPLNRRYLLELNRRSNSKFGRGYVVVLNEKMIYFITTAE